MTIFSFAQELMASIPTMILVLFSAIALDYLLGEPSRFHPLVGFGRLAKIIELKFNRYRSKAASLIMGGTAWFLLVVPFTFAVQMIPSQNLYLEILTSSINLYFCIAHRSLKEHNWAIYCALLNKNTPLARTEISKIVSRDCEHLDETGISKAAIESVLENGADAITAPLFWFVLLGPSGAVLYRLANTLDAMWGYRTARYSYFGRVAARIDDLLNYIPARLTALSYCVLADSRSGLRAWKNQAHRCSSPNAGPVMSAGAGALNISVGGTAKYHGKLQNKPVLGCGDWPNPGDLKRAMKLVSHCLLLWIIVIILINFLLRAIDHALV